MFELNFSKYSIIAPVTWRGRFEEFAESRWARQTGVFPASTRLRLSSGSSPTDATRNLAKARLQVRLDEVACVLERDPVKHVAEEALDDHPLGRGRGDAARLEVEHALRVDRPHRRAMRAADVVVVDLEHRDRGGLGVGGEHEVAVGLVRVRARGALLDADQSRIDGSRGVLERALEQQVGSRVADLVILQGVKVEELLSRCEVDRLQLCVRTPSDQRGFDARLRKLRAERDVEEPQPSVLLEAGPLGGGKPRGPPPLLNGDPTDLCAFADEELRRATSIDGRLTLSADVLSAVAEAGAPPPPAQPVRHYGGAALLL